jgi:hypothetical protein
MSRFPATRIPEEGSLGDSEYSQLGSSGLILFRGRGEKPSRPGVGVWKRFGEGSKTSTPKFTPRHPPEPSDGATLVPSARRIASKTFIREREAQSKRGRRAASPASGPEVQLKEPCGPCWQAPEEGSNHEATRRNAHCRFGG